MSRGVVMTSRGVVIMSRGVATCFFVASHEFLIFHGQESTIPRSFVLHLHYTSRYLWWRHAISNDVTLSLMTSRYLWWRHFISDDVTLSLMTSLFRTRTCNKISIREWIRVAGIYAAHHLSEVIDEDDISQAAKFLLSIDYPPRRYGLVYIALFLNLRKLSFPKLEASISLHCPLPEAMHKKRVTCRFDNSYQ